MELLTAIAAIQALLRLVGELENRGATLTPAMRQTREDQRRTLNALWQSHLAQHRQDNPGAPDPVLPGA